MCRATGLLDDCTVVFLFSFGRCRVTREVGRFLPIGIMNFVHFFSYILFVDADCGHYGCFAVLLKILFIILLFFISGCCIILPKRIFAFCI